MTRLVVLVATASLCLRSMAPDHEMYRGGVTRWRFDGSSSEGFKMAGHSLEVREFKFGVCGGNDVSHVITPVRDRCVQSAAAALADLLRRSVWTAWYVLLSPRRCDVAAAVALFVNTVRRIRLMANP